MLSNSFPLINIRTRLLIESRIELFKTTVPFETLFKIFLAPLYSNYFLARPGMVEKLMEIMQARSTSITENGYLNQKQALFDFDSTNWLSKITCPCLVINADDDVLVSAASGKEMAQKIPGAEFYCFKNAGHIPHHEQPELFVKIISDFISSLSKPQGVT